MTTELITIVEIDQPYCALTYGSAPCTAALGTTGEHKCFNTWATCQDQDNYDATELTLRFFSEVENPPKNLQMLPLVRGVNSRPTELNIVGGDPGSSPLGKRARVTIRMGDMPYHDRLVDKYWRDRLSGAGQSSGVGYDPAERGTFWTKWLARNPNYATIPVRVRRGTIDQASGSLSNMQTEHYILDSIDGPGSRGEVTVTAKDILALADNDRAVAPAPSPGRIQAEITAAASAPITVTLLPEGAGTSYSGLGQQASEQYAVATAYVPDDYKGLNIYDSSTDAVLYRRWPGDPTGLDCLGVQYDPNGTWVAVLVEPQGVSNATAIVIYDASTFSILQTIEYAAISASPESSTLRVSADGRFLAYPYGVYETSNWTLVLDLEYGSPQQLGNVRDIAFSPDGNYLCMTWQFGNSPYVQVWDTSDWSTVSITFTSSFSEGGGCDFSPDGSTLRVAVNAFSTPYDTVIEIDTTTWTETGYFRVPNQWYIAKIRHSNDGNYVALATSGGLSGTIEPIRVYDVSGSPRVEVTISDGGLFPTNLGTQSAPTWKSDDSEILVSIDNLSTAGNAGLYRIDTSDWSVSVAIADREALYAVDYGPPIPAQPPGVLRIGSELFPYTRSGDVLTLTARGAYGTQISSHQAGSAAQDCYVVTNTRVDSVIEDLLTNYAGVDAAYINTSDWGDEAGRWLSTYDLNAVVSEPTGVTQLIGEILQVCTCFVWWDAENQQIRFRALRPQLTARDVDDTSHILADSFQQVTKADERITQLIIFYDQINPTERQNEGSNYARANVFFPPGTRAPNDTDERVRTIHTRWMSGANIGEVVSTGTKIMQRYYRAPIKTSFALDRSEDDIELADVVGVFHHSLTDVVGDAREFPAQIIGIERLEGGSRIQYTAIPYDFAGRFGYIVANGTLPYLFVSGDQRQFGAWFADETTNEMPNGDPAYVFA